MKPLPKEFQFKCDENSLKQCELLGIQLDDWDIVSMKYSSESYYLIKESGIDYNYKPYCQDLYPLISLADYLEHNVESNYSEKPNSCPDHSDLIVELTGKYVIGGYDVPHAIKLAEETIKQLKEKGYLK